MITMTAPWYRSFRRHLNGDGPVDSICAAYYRTIARSHRYVELEQIESEHRCEEPDLGYTREIAAAVSALPLLDSKAAA